MRAHVIYYYAQEQLLRGEKIFDFSSRDENSSKVSQTQTQDLKCVLRSINKTKEIENQLANPKNRSFLGQRAKLNFKIKKNKCSGYFDADVSEIQKYRFKGEEIDKVGVKKHKLRNVEFGNLTEMSFESIQFISTPSSKKEIIFRKGWKLRVLYIYLFVFNI